MDGTLVDSEPLHADSVRVTGDELGFPVSEELLEKSLGVGYAHCFQMLQDHLNMSIGFKEWSVCVENAYLKLAETIKPRQNIIEIVRALHARGIKQAVFSNSPRKIVRANTDGFLRFFHNPSEIFTHLISADDVSNTKPDPEGYFLAAQKFGLGTDECLVIEDSPTGVRAGVAAGCFTILWKHPTLSPEFPIAPDMIVDDLGALLL
jgi:HAD superfamily hydrolase (TIGR01509 family)